MSSLIFLPSHLYEPEWLSTSSLLQPAVGRKVEGEGKPVLKGTDNNCTFLYNHLLARTHSLVIANLV